MNKSLLFLKNMLLKNKYFKVSLLLFFVAAIIIPWLAFGEDVTTGYRLNHLTEKKVVHYTDSTHTATSSTCLLSNSNNDYFIPTNTYKEWVAFATSTTLARVNVQAPVAGCTVCGDLICDTIGGESHATCPGDCPGEVCVDNPTNGFIGAAYTTRVDTGTAGGGGCDSSNAFGMNGYTVNFTPSSVVYQDPEGSQGHTYETKWYTQCATLFKSPRMCTNNYCVLGVTYPDIYNGNWFQHDPNKSLPHNATFYYGHYDATNNICVLGDLTSGGNGRYPQFVGGNPSTYTAGRLSILDQGNPWTAGVISANRYDTVGSWGATGNCGDHICDLSRGEGSSGCITDCGSSADYCVNNNGCIWNKTCNSSCFATINCSSYNSSTCASAGCHWNPASGFDARCESLYNCATQFNRTNCENTTGCSWKGVCS